MTKKKTPAQLAKDYPLLWEQFLENVQDFQEAETRSAKAIKLKPLPKATLRRLTKQLKEVFAPIYLATKLFRGLINVGMNFYLNEDGELLDPRLTDETPEIWSDDKSVHSFLTQMRQISPYLDEGLMDYGTQSPLFEDWFLDAQSDPKVVRIRAKYERIQKRLTELELKGSYYIPGTQQTEPFTATKFISRCY